MFRSFPCPLDVLTVSLCDERSLVLNVLKLVDIMMRQEPGMSAQDQDKKSDRQREDEQELRHNLFVGTVSFSVILGWLMVLFAISIVLFVIIIRTVL